MTRRSMPVVWLVLAARPQSCAKLGHKSNALGGRSVVSEELAAPSLPPAVVVRRVFALRSWLGRAADRMFPPTVLAAEAMFAPMEVKLVGVTCELGVPEALDTGPRSAGDLATELGLDADALERVLRYLAARGWYKRRRNGTYQLTARSRLLRADDPDSLRDWVRFMSADWHWDIWSHISTAIREGGSAARAANGYEFFEWAHDHHETASDTFDGAMQSLSGMAGPLLARTIDLSGSRSVCDVGGGTGRTLAAVLARHPSVQGTLYDLPDVVAQPVGLLDAVAAGRWEATGGDFFEEVPADHDTYILQAVLHDWDDERAGQILANIRTAMGSTGRVHVMDQILDPRQRDSMATAVDVLMLNLADGGRERTSEEWDRLFESSGFRIVERSQLPILTWVLTVEPR